MAAATITEGSVHKGAGVGFGVYLCHATLSATETTAVTIDTGMKKVFSCQATWATAHTTASGLICTAAAGTGLTQEVSLQATNAPGGTTQAWVLVFGLY